MIGHRVNLRCCEPLCVTFRVTVIGALALCGLVAVPPGASATVVVPADFVEMVGESQIIVHGRVAEVRPYMNDRQSIESLVIVTVTQALKGNVGSTVVFRVPNGQVGRYRRVTLGAPEFTAGDEIVVFLKGRPPVIPTPYGLHQGVYRVRRAAQNRTQVSPAPAVGGHADTARLVRGDAARHAMTIEAFASHVRAITGTAEPAGRTAVPRAPAEAGRARPERQR